MGSMSSPQPLDALRAAHLRLAGPTALTSRLIVAGATGVLGNEVLNRLLGVQRFQSVQVLARTSYTETVRGLQIFPVQGDAPAQWPPVAAETGVVMFDPPRLYYQRERALWTPSPKDVPELARWMRRCGVQTLAVVLPHSTGSLPQALKAGLANLDEQQLSTLGFERLILVRSAVPAAPAGAGQAAGHFLQRMAHGLLSALHFMVPDNQRPVRASHVARLVEGALLQAPEGIHVASPELVWRAAQAGRLQPELQQWLGRPAPSEA